MSGSENADGAIVTQQIGNTRYDILINADPGTTKILGTYPVTEPKKSLWQGLKEYFKK